MRKVTLLLPVLIVVLFTSCAQTDGKTKAVNDQQQPNEHAADLPDKTEVKDFNGVSITIPAGWQIFKTAECSDLSFIAWDAKHTERQLFLFGSAGPFYTDAEQKQVNDQYTQMSGVRTPLTGSPIIDPLTPSNFITQFYRIEDMPEVKAVFKKLPGLRYLKTIAAVPQQSMLSVPSTSAIVHAVFSNEQKTQANEGLFLVTVIPFQISTYGPNARFGMAASFIGVTAGVDDFEELFPILKKCLDAFNISNAYATNCINQQNQQWAIVREQGTALAKTSESIMQAWENKNKSEEISSRKFSDAILGRERVYDPETREVFTVSNTFYDQYNLHRDQYNRTNLQKLPDDNGIWKMRPKNGVDFIRVK